MGRDQRERRSLNYTSARQRAEKQSLGFTGSYLKLPDGVQLFKPKVGQILIDILPFVAGKGNPWAQEGAIHWERTYFAHRGLGANSESFLCPRANAKKPCPVCEHRQRLRERGDEQDEQAIKDLADKQRQLFNVIDLKNPDKGIQLWDMSYHCFGRALDARLRNSDDQDGWEQFFFLEGGLSLRVGLAEKSMGGFSFLDVESIDFKPRKDYPESILDETYCLDDLLILPGYDELKTTFLEIRSDRSDDKAGGPPEDRRGGRQDAPQDDPPPTRRGRRDQQEDPPQDDPPPPPRRGRQEQSADNNDQGGSNAETEPDWDRFENNRGRGSRAQQENPPQDDPPPPPRRGRQEQPPQDDPPPTRRARREQADNDEQPPREDPPPTTSKNRFARGENEEGFRDHSQDRGSGQPSRPASRGSKDDWD